MAGILASTAAAGILDKAVCILQKLANDRDMSHLWLSIYLPGVLASEIDLTGGNPNNGLLDSGCPKGLRFYPYYLIWIMPA